jgi:small ligand-binding sensory domain FIST
MISAGLGISERTDARAAAAEVTAAALARVERPQAALLFAGPGLGPELPLLLDAVAAELGTDAIAGATAHGVLGGGRELLARGGVALLALAGLEAQPFLIADAGGDGLAAGEELAARLGGEARAEDLVVVLPDPRSFDAAAFLPALRRALGPAHVVGAGAADPLAGEPLQWCGRTLAAGGVAGMLLRGARPPRIGVTQACRPASEILRVTRSRGHWILELDGRPALDVYREVARGPLAADLRRAAAFLLVARPLDPQARELEPGSYLVRHVIGFEPDANAFAIPEAVEPGSRIALVQREPVSAREDLKAMLERLGSPAPAFGLYFDCCARDAGFFGVEGLEAAYLESVFGQAPVAGMYGSCEIGPVGGRTELLTYTGVLALVDA